MYLLPWYTSWWQWWLRATDSNSNKWNNNMSSQLHFSKQGMSFPPCWSVFLWETAILSLFGLSMLMLKWTFELQFQVSWTLNLQSIIFTTLSNYLGLNVSWLMHKHWRSEHCYYSSESEVIFGLKSGWNRKYWPELSIQGKRCKGYSEGVSILLSHTDDCQI
jgi:hypothetical protein